MKQMHKTYFCIATECCLFSVSKADLEDQAKAAEREFDEFLMETRCALLLENPTSSRKQFSHSAELENGHLKVGGVATLLPS